MSIFSQPITLQSLFGPKRTIGTIDVQVIISESTTDVLTITKQPVQQGASITDHAYKEPTLLTMTALFKDNDVRGVLTPFSSSGLRELYQKLLELQISRSPFIITTPKRIYNSMLLATLSQVTDKNTENCLSVTMSFQEVVLVSIGTIQVDPKKLKKPKSNSPTKPAGNKSIAKTLVDGVQAGFKR